MATNYKYPFQTGEDLKKAASQVNLNFDIDNIQSSLALAANDLKDVVSQAVWDKMIDYYNSGNYNPEGDSVNDKLVNAFLAPLANMAVWHHFIWLQLNISNSGITVTKSDHETAAYKYQTDEAKQKLLQSAWVETSNLIDFLNANATVWTPWAAKTAYKAGQKVKYLDNYYEARNDVTSGDAFDVTNWNLLNASDIILPEWMGSKQYAELKGLVFDGYKDFDKYFSIDRNAAFYIRCRYLIAEIIKEDIYPRLGTGQITDEVMLIKVKRYLAYKTMALALLRFDPFHLPVSIRQSIQNNMTKTNNDFNYLKEKYSAGIENRAARYLEELDMYREQKDVDEIPDTEPYDNYEQKMDDDQKFVSML